MIWRILRTAQVTLSHVFDPDEIPTAATGPVTVTIARLDGTVVSTGAATGPDEAQTYTYPYAGSALLDLFTVTWSATVAGDAITLDQDRLEIVGGHMFGIGDARKQEPALQSVAKYPTTTLVATRIEVEDEAERICDQAFVPRFSRDYLDGSGTASLKLDWPLTRAVRKISITNVTGAAFVDFTAAQLAAVSFGDDGVLRLDSGFFWSITNWWGAYWVPGRRNVIVEYEHGRDAPPPSISRAGRTRLKSMVLESTAASTQKADLPAGAVSALTLPDRDSTGIPSVDAAYSRMSDPRPGFG